MNSADIKILVVDDDINLLDLLIDTLSAIGYSSDGVTDGFKALEKLKTGHFDLVISDIKMPEMDGISLLREIRQTHPGLPVLFITGVDVPEVVAQASPDGLLAKPFRVSHIEQLINDTLNVSENVVAGKVRKVMIIDDDDNFRTTLEDALEANDFIPFAVAAGDEAIMHLEKGNFDAVVSDIRMPGIDGFDLLKRIKKTYPKLPVVLMTAYLSEKDVREALPQAGADGFLEKPFGVDQIVDILTKL